MTDSFDFGLDLDALIEMTVNAAQIEDGVNPRLVMARSKTAVPVAMLQTDGVNQRSGVWTEDEETFLRENLGVLSMEEIAAALGRTATAVKIRWTRKGYHAPSKQPGDIVANKVGKMLGMCVKKVIRLIDMGVMPGRTIPGQRNIHVVDRFQLLRWCVQPANWIYLKVHRIKDQRIKRLVEMRQERWDDAWWTTGQVAKYYGLTSTTVINRRIREGHLPAIRWDNWYVLRSDALAQTFYKGKGGATGLDWSMAGDAFMVLAAAVGIPADYIDMLRNEPKERSWNRLRYLVSKRKVKPLIIGYHLPVQQRGKLLFADWRDVRGRFPTLCRTVEKFKDGRALSHIDRQYLRGIMRSWARWHGLDALAQRLNWAQAALDEALRGFYQELLDSGVDPFGDKQR